MSMVSILAHLSGTCCDGGKLETSFALYAQRGRRVRLVSDSGFALDVPRNSEIWRRGAGYYALELGEGIPMACFGLVALALVSAVR